MKSPVKATALYKEGVETVRCLTEYIRFLSTEPDFKTMKDNIGKLEDLEAQLKTLTNIVTVAKENLDVLFKKDESLKGL